MTTKDTACSIGIDVGTTSVKVVALRSNNVEITRTARRLATLHTSPERAEQSPNHVYEQVMEALTEVVDAVRKCNLEVREIGLSTAMHSLLAVDKDDIPLTDAAIWMDVRAAEEAKELWESELGIAVYQSTGTPIHPMSPLLKIIWQRKYEREIFDRTHKFVSLKEWIWHRWFREWCVDEAMVSATGLYGYSQRKWDDKALQLAHITTLQLSRCVPTTYVRTVSESEELQRIGFSNTATSVNIGASDGVLANLGLGAIDGREMVLTIGTSTAVRLGHCQPVTDVLTQSFCYVLTDDKFILGGPSNSGGILIEWLHQNLLHAPGAESQLGSQRDIADLLQAAENISIQQLVCLPYIAGERAPLWRPDAKAAFIGAELHHSQVHFVRAAVEGILLNAAIIANHLSNQVEQATILFTSGKLLEVPWIRQLAADIFNLPVRHQHDVDASVLGAIILARISTGHMTWDDVLKINRSNSLDNRETDLLPRSSKHQHYRLKLERFRALSNALLQVTDALSNDGFKKGQEHH